MYRRPERPEITVPGVDSATADVLFENRSVSIIGGKLIDDFEPYAIYRYRISQ